MVTKERST